MTGDELEPVKPNMGENDRSEGEAYVKAMMAKQNFYMPDEGSEESSQKIIDPNVELKQEQYFLPDP